MLFDGFRWSVDGFSINNEIRLAFLQGEWAD